MDARTNVDRRAEATTWLGVVDVLRDTVTNQRRLTAAEVTALTEGWPKSWAYGRKDEPIGRDMVLVVREFMAQLEGEGLSPRTRRGHLDNLWLLGGEIVRRMQNEHDMRQRSGRALLHTATEAGEAILIHGLSEAEHDSVDRTARRLARYLSSAGK